MSSWPPRAEASTQSRDNRGYLYHANLKQRKDAHVGLTVTRGTQRYSNGTIQFAVLAFFAFVRRSFGPRYAGLRTHAVTARALASKRTRVILVEPERSIVFGFRV